MSTPQPAVLHWSDLEDKEILDLIPNLATTDNWILHTQPLGASNKPSPPLERRSW